MRLTIPLAVPYRKVISYRQRQRWGDALTIVLFLLPALVLFVLFVVIPVVQAANYSLYRWRGFGSPTNYIGLQNYLDLFDDEIFRKALQHNFLIAGLSLVFQLPASIFLALLVNQKMPGRTFFRTVFFLPYVLSEVVTGLIWKFIYDPLNGGLISGVVRQFDPHATPPAFLADPNTVLYAIFLAMSWKYFGFHLILYLAGLQNIPNDVIEAARVDGANSWQVARYVTLPLLGSTIRLSAFLSVLGSLQYFDLIWVMSEGGPAGTNASETMATFLLHYGLKVNKIGYGSAVGVVMFGLCLIFALFYQRIIMRQDLRGSSAL